MERSSAIIATTAAEPEIPSEIKREFFGGVRTSAMGQVYQFSDAL